LNDQLSQQNTEKDQELESLREQLNNSGPDVVAALQKQIDEMKKTIKEVSDCCVCSRSRRMPMCN